MSSVDFFFEVSFETLEEKRDFEEIGTEEIFLLGVVAKDFEEVGVEERKSALDFVDVVLEFLSGIGSEVFLKDAFRSVLFLQKLDFSETVVGVFSFVDVVGVQVGEVEMVLDGLLVTHFSKKSELCFVR